MRPENTGPIQSFGMTQILNVLTLGFTSSDVTQGCLVYRVAHLLANLGWVDLDLGCYPGWWPLL